MRIRRSKEWWKSHHDTWCASGLSIGSYSNDNKINKSTFCSWIKKFRDFESDSNDSNLEVQWATLSNPSSENSTRLSENTFSIKIGIGKEALEIQKDFNSEMLDKVVKVPTHVAGTIELKNSVIASRITSFDIWDSTLPRIEIYGSMGTLIVSNLNTFDGPVILKMEHGDEFKEIPVTHIYSENSRGIGVSDMARCIETGDKPRASGELANDVLEIMHTFHISSDTKKYVELSTIKSVSKHSFKMLGQTFLGILT